MRGLYAHRRRSNHDDDDDDVDEWTNTERVYNATPLHRARSSTMNADSMGAIARLPSCSSGSGKKRREHKKRARKKGQRGKRSSGKVKGKAKWTEETSWSSLKWFVKLGALVSEGFARRGGESVAIDSSAQRLSLLCAPAAAAAAACVTLGVEIKSNCKSAKCVIEIGVLLPAVCSVLFVFMPGYFSPVHANLNLSPRLSNQFADIIILSQSCVSDAKQRH